MFFCSSSYGKAADCFAQGGMLMVLLPHSLLLSMPHTYYGSIELLSRMSAFLLKKLLYYFFNHYGFLLSQSSLFIQTTPTLSQRRGMASPAALYTFSPSTSRRRNAAKLQPRS
jgi:hypothetical protein